MALPNPTADINAKLFKFLWDGKPDTIKRSQTFMNYSEGGFKMINLDNFIKALKITWIRRLYKKPNAPFAILFKITITDLKNLFLQGTNYLKDILQSIKKHILVSNPISLVRTK